MSYICRFCNLPRYNGAMGLAAPQCKCACYGQAPYPNPTDEDVEFKLLEDRIKRQEDQKVHEYLHRAQVESVKFCETYANDLPLMTLRKAFELGFRTGYSAAQGEKK